MTFTQFHLSVWSPSSADVTHGRSTYRVIVLLVEINAKASSRISLCLRRRWQLSFPVAAVRVSNELYRATSHRHTFHLCLVIVIKAVLWLCKGFSHFNGITILILLSYRVFCIISVVPFPTLRSVCEVTYVIIKHFNEYVNSPTRAVTKRVTYRHAQA